MQKYLVLFCLTIIGGTITAQTLVGKSNTVNVDYSTKIPDPNVVPGSPTYYALVVGISEYQNAGAQFPNLDQPVKDASRLFDVLMNNYTFDREKSVLLTNPTREQIIDQLDKLSHIATDRDNVFIFYAGHGYYDKKRDFGYWLPADAKAESTSSWIPNSTIKDYVQAIPAKHTFLVTDACFGGSIFKTRAVSTQDMRKFNEIYRDKSRKAMTSGNLSVVPDKSFFIEFLIKVLSENDVDYLPAGTLYTRLYEPVMNNSSTVPQFGVIQGAGDEGGDFIFIKKSQE
jgi:hypothetical protein